jgi:hypothetical protein
MTKISRAWSVLSLIVVLGLTGCAQSLVRAVIPPPASNISEVTRQSPLELQALQSRDFQVSKARAVSAILSTLQDQGYVLDQVDLAAGIVVAIGPVEKLPVEASVEAYRESIEGTPSVGERSPCKGFKEIVSSASILLVERENKETRVRASMMATETLFCGPFKIKVGEPTKHIETDPRRYQDFFSRLQQALFVQDNTR